MENQSASSSLSDDPSEEIGGVETEGLTSHRTSPQLVGLAALYNPVSVVFSLTESEREAFVASLEAWEAENGADWQTKRVLWEPQNKEDPLVLTKFCNQRRLAELWANKDRLDALFDSSYSLGQFYYLERMKFFKVETADHPVLTNKTASIFPELLETAQISLSKDTNHVFVDIYGAPGAVSEQLLAHNPKNRGWGITLETATPSRLHPSWSPRLLSNPAFTRVVGHTGDGNIFKPENVTYFRDQIIGLDQKISYAIGDGNVAVKNIREPTGETIHQENMQELFALRLVVSEFLAALLVLSEGGHLILKIFDTFSDQSASMILMAMLCFNDCMLIKPGKARHINSEKYLVGRGFRRDQPLTQKIIEYLTYLHKSWQYEMIPTVIIPPELFVELENFRTTLTHLNEACLEPQNESFKTIMDNIARNMPSSFALRYQQHIDKALPDLFAKKKACTASSVLDELKAHRLSSLVFHLANDSQIITCRPIHFAPRPAPQKPIDTSQSGGDPTKKRRVA